MRKEFLRTFFWSSDIESKCFCFCRKNFQEARQNSIPSVPVKTFFEIFWRKFTIFHHCRKFSLKFSAFRWKNFTCNVKTALWVFRGTFCGKFFFLDKLNLICPLWTLRKKCRPFDKKVTAGFSRLRSACPEDLFEKHFFWSSYIFISLSLINEKALLFCLISFRQCIQSSSLKFRRNQLQKQYFELLLLFYQLRTMSEKISVFCWTILEKVVGTEN